MVTFFSACGGVNALLLFDPLLFDQKPGEISMMIKLSGKKNEEKNLSLVVCK